MKTIYFRPLLALFLAILCAVLFSGRLNHADSHFSTRFSRGKKLLMARFENIFAPNKKKGTWIIVAFAVLIVFMGGCFGFKLTESTPEERDPASSATESNPVSSKPVISKPIRSVPVSSALCGVGDAVHAAPWQSRPCSSGLFTAIPPRYPQPFCWA